MIQHALAGILEVAEDLDESVLSVEDGFSASLDRATYTEQVDGERVVLNHEIVWRLLDAS